MIRSIPGLFASIMLAFILAGCDSVFAAGQTTGREGDDSSEHVLQDRVLGNPDAPLTLIEYASWTCPACGDFHTKIMPTIIADYINTGQVKLILREFPTGPVNLSVAGFVLARCAGPERYYDVIDELFARQSAFLTLARNGGQIVEALKQVAGNHGIAGDDAWQACLDDPAHRDAIKASIAMARTMDVNATPTFILNGKKLAPGAHVSQGTFTAILDEAIATTQGG